MKKKYTRKQEFIYWSFTALLFTAGLATMLFLYELINFVTTPY